MRPLSIFLLTITLAAFIALTSVALADGDTLTARFTSNVTGGTAPLTVQFNDTSTGNITGWQWNFGDGSSNATEPNPAYTYTSDGTFAVMLTVYNGSENSTTTHGIVVVAPPTPTPTSTPTPQPNNTSTTTPSPTPTKKPTPKPTTTPKPTPTTTPTPKPTPTPTQVPTPMPTPEPTVTSTPTPFPLPSQSPVQTGPPGKDYAPGIVAFVGFNLFLIGVAGCAYFLFFKKEE